MKILIVLLGVILMASCQKEVITPRAHQGEECGFSRRDSEANSGTEGDTHGNASVVVIEDETTTDPTIDEGELITDPRKRKDNRQN